MIVRTTDDITGTERDVSDGTWRSKRIILADDAVGFSFHETTIQAGSVNEFHYQYHVEAVWLVEGTGTLLDKETGEMDRVAAVQALRWLSNSLTPTDTGWKFSGAWTRSAPMRKHDRRQNGSKSSRLRTRSTALHLDRIRR